MDLSCFALSEMSRESVKAPIIHMKIGWTKGFLFWNVVNITYDIMDYSALVPQLTAKHIVLRRKTFFGQWGIDLWFFSFIFTFTFVTRLALYRVWVSPCRLEVLFFLSPPPLLVAFLSVCHCRIICMQKKKKFKPLIKESKEGHFVLRTWFPRPIRHS